MPSDSVRFIHASRLMLDHQLRGVGGCPPDSRTLIEDATLIAFERVIDACLAQEVDFLLLVGDSFERHDQGLRGQAALARGLARLDEKNIPAYVTSGRRDPWSAWLPGLRFTDNVHRIEPNAVPVTFQRDGRTLARVSALDTIAIGETLPVGLRGGHRPELHDAAWSIALVYWDDAYRLRPSEDRQKTIQEWLGSRRGLGIGYWALGGSESASSWPLETGLAHDPGSPQALRSGEDGPHGCTLWELDTGIKSTFLPTSPVRYETRLLSIGSHWRRDDLLQAMRQALEPQAADADERELVWVVTWRFEGEGSLFDALLLPSFRAELQETLRETFVGRTVVHDFRPPVFAPRSLLESDRFSPEFLQLLASRAGRSPAELLACSPLQGTHWESRLTAASSDVDDREISQSARGAGLRWLAAREGVPA